jgi:hypothetical protein
MRRASLLTPFICLVLAAQGQDPQPKPKSYVVYAAEAQTVAAGKRAVLDLRFHVVDGYHVNSHTPKSELLIPTLVVLPTTDGVKAEPLQYPPGKLYSFSFEPGEKLDVYAGDFTVKVPVVAAAGDHEIDGTLKYQACDNASCYPPKSLPIKVMFTAK